MANGDWDSGVTTDEDAKYLVPALDRGLRVLSVFTRQRPELNTTEISQHLGLPYATTYRLLYTLEQHGLLNKTQSGFRLGSGILRLGFDYLSSLDITEFARPEMERLRDDTGASANLGILEGVEMIYIAHVPSPRPLATRLGVGSRLPAHLSSIGRLILAAMPEQQVRHLFQHVDFRGAGGRMGSVGDLLHILREDRARGYIVAEGTYDVGVVAVAAPIFDQSGRTVAGVNISGPVSWLDSVALHGRIKDQVCQAARSISAQLGYRQRA
jgi:DNA-binding IclR family transcriptional regulator